MEHLHQDDHPSLLSLHTDQFGVLVLSSTAGINVSDD